MKAYLMYADRDFGPISMPKPTATRIVPDRGFGQIPSSKPSASRTVTDLIQDIELDTFWDGMARGDEFLRIVAQRGILSSLTSVEQIRYRQRVLEDCLENRTLVRELYDLAVEAITAEREFFRGFFSEHGEALLRRSVQVIDMFVGMLRRLRQLTEDHGAAFRSDGFGRFFAQLRQELDDDYFAEIEAHLKMLRFREGVVMSARLGEGGRGTGYQLRSPRPENRGTWYSRSILKKPTFSFTIPERDDAGFRALGAMRDRALNIVAEAVGQSSDHILSFFVALRTELGFYIGALNLHEQLADKQGPVCFPDPSPPGELILHARDLYDPCLSLRMGQRAVGNDVDADGKELIIITGANQGGKSTFLRSVGLAHLMMQAGLFIAAASFASTVTYGVFTHYLREEDATLTSGKFDEELARMSIIADAIKPNCLLICNESFAATNEREGSDIAAEIIRAMNDAGIRIVFVTHMYDLARRYENENTVGTLFLRADRGEEGHRSFQLHEAVPLPTSFGEDVYRRIFPQGHADGESDGSSPADRFTMCSEKQGK